MKDTLWVYLQLNGNLSYDNPVKSGLANNLLSRGTVLLGKNVSTTQFISRVRVMIDRFTVLIAMVTFDPKIMKALFAPGYIARCSFQISRFVNPCREPLTASNRENACCLSAVYSIVNSHIYIYIYIYIIFDSRNNDRPGNGNKGSVWPGFFLSPRFFPFSWKFSRADIFRIVREYMFITHQSVRERSAEIVS